MTKDIATQTQESPKSEDQGDFLVSPKGYDEEFAEAFAELPYKWRRYLSAREDAYDKGFSNLNSRLTMYQWLEDAYKSVSADLLKEGVISMEEWLHRLIDVEKQLRTSPKETLQKIAAGYGIAVACPQKSDLPKNKTAINDILHAKLIEQQIQEFINSKDDEGKLKHPFYADVFKEICMLMQRGLAQTLSEAYEMAVWCNQATRNKMIAEKINSDLQTKTKEAQKSKAASFAANGKAEPDFKKMSLREELEHRFAELGLLDE